MPLEEWNNEEYCRVCKKETPHAYTTGTHERDSFNDSKICTVCETVTMGFEKEF